MLTETLGSEDLDKSDEPHMPKKQQIVEAMNHLITSSNYAKLINEMTQIIEKWDSQPAVYSGHMAALNPIIDIGLQNRDAFEKLLKLVEQKRRLAPTTKRADYQRQLMRERRARLSKALELEELSQGPLTTSRKRELEKHLSSTWGEARRKFIAEKGEISWAERNQASHEFWDNIDRQLDTSLQSARRRVSVDI